MSRASISDILRCFSSSFAAIYSRALSSFGPCEVCFLSSLLYDLSVSTVPVIFKQSRDGPEAAAAKTPSQGTVIKILLKHDGVHIAIFSERDRVFLVHKSRFSVALFFIVGTLT